MTLRGFMDCACTGYPAGMTSAGADVFARRTEGIHCATIEHDRMCLIVEVGIPVADSVRFVDGRTDHPLTKIV